MKKVLVLGAGLVARPLVQYLLQQDGYTVTVASRTVSKAERLVAGHERGTALPLDVNDRDALDRLVSEHDLSVSLLPYTHHATVAELCLEHKKHMVTTSYVSDEMRALDGKARAAGLTFLNEIGLDPGIDHMSAMKIVHRIERSGGRVTGFHSYCGGLPAPEANTNPWGYKFSWSPRGVMLAGRNDARFLRAGGEVRVPGPELFAHHWLVEIKGYGELEAYPNRDSIPYIDLYGLHDVKDMLRGTLRNPGWCFTMQKLAELDYFSLEEGDAAGLTYAELTARLAGVEAEGDLRNAIAQRLEVHPAYETMNRLSWLGLLEDRPVITNGADTISPLDALANLMLEKLVFEEGERDCCVMQHEITGEYKGGRKEKTYSTLCCFGIPGGESAMSRTVSLPAAIGTRMILEGAISEPGVLIPTLPAVYEPLLEELEKGAGILFEERTVPG